jgi:hypothetical protein
MAAADDFSTGDGRATAAVPWAGTDGAGLLHGRRRHFSTGDSGRSVSTGDSGRSVSTGGGDPSPPWAGVGARDGDGGGGFGRRRCGRQRCGRRQWATAARGMAARGMAMAVRFRLSFLYVTDLLLLLWIENGEGQGRCAHYIDRDL